MTFILVLSCFMKLILRFVYQNLDDRLHVICFYPIKMTFKKPNVSIKTSNTAYKFGLFCYNVYKKACISHKLKEMIILVHIIL